MSYELYIRQRGVDELSSSQHAHDNLIEIVQILSGTGRILVGDNFCVFRPGDVFVIDTGIIHCTSPDIPDRYVRNKLLFDRALLARLTGEIPLSLTSYFRESNPDVLTKRFDRLEALQESGTSKLSVCAEIMLLLDFCLSRKSERYIPDNSTSSRIITYINENLLSSLSLDAISSAMHISKFHLSRTFKSETGMTIGGYVHTSRLSYAKKRLLFSEDSVGEIAVQLGYNDAAAFSKAFLSETGLSPTAYRKQISELQKQQRSWGSTAAKQYDGQ